LLNGEIFDTLLEARVLTERWRREYKLGTIEAGKLADLQVINSNPLESFDALGHPEIVMVGGDIHRYE